MAVIVIEDWMVERMHLSGTELLAFALIHTCTQNGDGCWHGGYENMGRRIGASYRATIDVVNRLIKNGLIKKDSKTINRRPRTILTSAVSCANFSCADFSCADSAHQAQIDFFSDISDINNSNKDRHIKKEKVEKERKISLPFYSPEFTQAWAELLTQPKWKKKTDSALQKSLNKLAKYPENIAIEAINNSISGDYQGIFPEKVGKATLEFKDKQSLSGYYKDLMKTMNERYGYEQPNPSVPDEQ